MGVVPPGEVHMPVCMCVYVYMYVFVHVSDGIYSRFARMCLGGCLMRWFYFGGEGEGTFAPPWKSVPSLHTNTLYTCTCTMHTTYM